jgi:hypothetical protein
MRDPPRSKLISSEQKLLLDNDQLDKGEEVAAWS